MSTITVLLVTIFIPTILSCPTNYFQTKSGVCKKCSPSCDGGRIMVKNCTAKQDIICKCPPGKYWETALVFCKRCTKCEQGQVIVVNCTHVHDRQCISCNPGAYAATPFRCKPCIYCKEGEYIKKRCSKTSNTICERIGQTNHEAIIHETMPTQKGLQLTTKKSKEHTPVKMFVKSDNVVLLTIIGVLGFLLVLVLSVVSIQRCSKRRRTLKKSSSITTESQESEHETFINRRILVPVVTEDPGYLARHMNPEIVIQLARHLNPPSMKDWHKVASRLGYSQIDISNFNIYKDQAFQMVFESWATTKDATVFKLYNIFIELERDDCASILQDVLTAERV